MGYMLATGPCIVCNQLFSFNPDRVPSVVYQGSREPVCRECVEWANVERVKKGLEPFTVLEGAYDAQEVG